MNKERNKKDVAVGEKVPWHYQDSGEKTSMKDSGHEDITKCGRTKIEKRWGGRRRIRPSRGKGEEREQQNNLNIENVYDLG